MPFAKGHKFSEETIAKLRAASLGHPGWFKGRKHTAEAIAKCSAAKKGKPSKLRGRVLSAEVRAKISAARKGRKFSEQHKENLRTSHKGCTPWNKGKCGFHHTEETKNRISLSLLGENGPNWRGGKSYEIYCDAWHDRDYKDSIKERDGYKCLDPSCSNSGTCIRLHVHHIDYEKKNCAPENLITLCINCHSRSNYDRAWHRYRYSEIIRKRYEYKKTTITRFVESKKNEYKL